jgi:hypothetical protein
LGKHIIVWSRAYTYTFTMLASNFELFHLC